jgi:hypothetical protein
MFVHSIESIELLLIGERCVSVLFHLSDLLREHLVLPIFHMKDPWERYGAPGDEL